MVEVRDAALREQYILEVMKNLNRPMSIPELFEVVRIKSVSKAQCNVRDTLRALHKRGEVRKLPKSIYKGNSVIMWEPKANLGQVLKEKLQAKMDNLDAPSRAIPATNPMGLSPAEPKVIAVGKRKPQITVTEHSVVIELDTIKITVEV